MKTKILFISLLCLSMINATSAYNKTVTLTDVEGIYSVKCSEYPGASTLTLSVNGVSDSINCDNKAPTGEVSYSPKEWTNGDVTVNIKCNDDKSGCEKSTYTKKITENGKGVIQITDKVGNKTDIVYNVNNIDKTNPSINGVICDGINQNGYSSDNVKCSVNLSNEGPSKDTLEYNHSTKDGELPKIGSSLSQKYTYTDNGTYKVGAKGYDKAGNEVKGKSQEFKIDTSKPSINTDFDFNGWYNENALTDIVFKVKDQVSDTTRNEETGLNSFEVKVNGTTVNTTGFNKTNGTDSINVTLKKYNLLPKLEEKENNTIEVKITDKVGNTQTIEKSLDYDNTKPNISFEDEDSDWRNEDVIAEVESTDSLSGIETTRYKVGSNLNNNCSDGSITAPTLHNTDGEYTVYACTKDKAGNVNKASQEYKIDKTNPEISATDSDGEWHQGVIEIILNTSDNKSGLEYSKYSWNSNQDCKINGVSFSDGYDITINKEGRNKLYLCNKDNAGNENEWVSEYYLIDKTNPKVDLSDFENSKKAGENNIIINEKVFDDEDKTDTSSLYGKNYELSYEIKITGPKQSGYEGKVIEDNTVNITATGTVVKNTKLDEKFNLTLAGKYDFTIKLEDKSGRTYEKEKTITIYPADLDSNKSSIKFDSSDKANGEAFANNTDEYTYTLELKDEYGNAIYNKDINNVEQNCDGLTGCKKITTNMVNNSGDNAISVSNNVITNKEGKADFTTKSIAPGEFTESFSIKMKKWNDKYEDTSIFEEELSTNYNNKFKKPYIAELNSQEKLNIGTMEKFNIELKDKGSIDSSVIGKELSFSNDSITDENGYIWENLSDISVSDNNYSFEARIDNSSDEKEDYTKGAEVKLSNLVISYNFSGETVKYKLDDSTITGEEVKTLGVEVIGTLQGSQNADKTGQEENFSDLSKAKIRSVIRSNAYRYIGSMNPDAEINGVKYVEGDSKISELDNDDIETLVVKDGNVIIDENIDKDKFGIIVLSDNYNVNNGASEKGNVFVTPNVTNINAVIYADGGLMSADSSGNLIYEDSSVRSNTLREQLRLNGTLFTRNTIGGAVNENNEYILPGGSKTTDFNKAMIYDLNYVRRGNDGEGANGDAYFIIKYDPSIQTNPPKLFN